MKSNIRKAPQRAANESVSPNGNVVDFSSGDPFGLLLEREKSWNRNIIEPSVVLQYEYGMTKQLSGAQPDHRINAESTRRWKEIERRSEEVCT